jgi:hypothetical protein
MPTSVHNHSATHLKIMLGKGTNLNSKEICSLQSFKSFLFNVFTSIPLHGFQIT